MLIFFEKKTICFKKCDIEHTYIPYLTVQNVINNISTILLITSCNVINNKIKNISTHPPLLLDK